MSESDKLRMAKMSSRSDGNGEATSADRASRELYTELDPSSPDLLEQLVASLKRLELGLDAIYAAVVALDERAQARARAELRDKQ